MSRVGQTILAGHGLVGEGRPMHRTADDKCRCRCGALSPAGLSQKAAYRWLDEHKDTLRAQGAAS